MIERIGVFIAESPWGDIDSSAIDRGLGGRETALVQLAMKWADAGIEVFGFVPRTGIARRKNLRWIPNEYTIEMSVALGLDLFVSWENVEVLKELKAEQFEGITAIEMQVAHLATYDRDDKVSDYADFICVLSQWAQEFFLQQHPDMVGRSIVLPNGVDLERFAEPPDVTVPEGYNFIYSSSPDRGLHHLLNMWPEIRNRIRDEYAEERVNLHICYGIENFLGGSRWSHRAEGQRAIDIEIGLDQPGVIYHGKVGQQELADLMMQCDALLYPCDTLSPTETGCITIIEALAAGAPVVTTNCDCLESEFRHVTLQTPLPFVGPERERHYIENILNVIDPEHLQLRNTMAQVGKEFVKKRDWAWIAGEWLAVFNEIDHKALAS